MKLQRWQETLLVLEKALLYIYDMRTSFRFPCLPPFVVLLSHFFCLFLSCSCFPPVRSLPHLFLILSCLVSASSLVSFTPVCVLLLAATILSFHIPSPSRSSSFVSLTSQLGPFVYHYWLSLPCSFFL